MPELNGHDATAPYVPPPQPPALAEPVKMSAKLTPAKLRDIQQRLREPFAAELVYFKPQVVSYKGAAPPSRAPRTRMPAPTPTA